jgi:hypothetical protein
MRSMGADFDALGVTATPRVNLGDLEARLEVIRPHELQVGVCESYIGTTLEPSAVPVSTAENTKELGKL